MALELNNNRSKVSVLMTIYNHQNYLKKSITSILSQSYKNWELIAIDNGSTDNSKKILESIKNKNVKVFFLKKNIGRTNCLNFGLKKCKGDFIAILDSDDIAYKNRLKDQINEFNLDNELFLLASDFNYMDHKNKILFKKNYISFHDLYKKPRVLLIRNVIAHSSVMFRKSLIIKVGDYPNKFLYAQDYAFYLKTFKYYKIKFLNKKLVKIRILHKNSETFNSSLNFLNIKENITLLFLSLKNFKTSLLEKLLIFSEIVKLILLLNIKIIKLDKLIRNFLKI